MKISTKGRYGLRAMVDLAANTKEGAVSLVNIANRQKLSLNYLEQVFAALRKAGLVRSIKGPQGGYMLAGDAQSIKIGDILTVLEGKFSIVDGAWPGREPDPVQAVIKELVWDKIDRQIQGFLDAVTLADLVERYQKLNIGEGNMYYI